jgi:hypothetical protein
MSPKKIEREELNIRERLGEAALSDLEAKIAALLSKKPHPLDGPSAQMLRSYIRGRSTLEDLAGMVSWEMWGEFNPDQTRDALQNVLERIGTDEDMLVEDCPICSRSDAASIDKDLLTVSDGRDGEFYWHLSIRYGVSDRALVAHRIDHLLPNLYEYIQDRRYAYKEAITAS